MLEVYPFYSKKTPAYGVITLANSGFSTAIGGLRILEDNLSEAALHSLCNDLAMTMREKAQHYNLPLNGGKAVLCNVKPNDLTVVLAEFADHINSLKGGYITAVDIGSASHEMKIISEHTPYVTCQTPERDPSGLTAKTVFISMDSVLGTVRNRKIAIQGAGKVGQALIHHCLNAGAYVTACDLDPSRLSIFSSHPRFSICSIDSIWSSSCDILSPCANSYAIDDNILNVLRCRYMLSAANNPLHPSITRDALQQNGIMSAPESIINGGGLLHCYQQYFGWDNLLEAQSIQHAQARLCQYFHANSPPVPAKNEPYLQDQAC